MVGDVCEVVRHLFIAQQPAGRAFTALQTGNQIGQGGRTGFEILDVNRNMLTEGWSIHELGTARMGTDSKTSVLNQFQQSHDVKNLFVVDGSSHVSASCQNPTWTIMALAWRSCDYLATEFRKGNL